MKIDWLTAFLDTPAVGFDERTRFWSSITGWRLSAFRGQNLEFATLEPPAGDPLLRVQRLDHGPAGVHIDLHVKDVNSAARAAAEIGAEVVSVAGHVIMKSPAGMSFCFVNNSDYSTPPTLESAVPHRVDQVSIDIPARRYEIEKEFWSALTSWSGRQSSYDEFLVLDQPDNVPLGLLLQRLGEDDSAATARAHLDLAAGQQVGRLVEIHRGLGARPIAEFQHWTVLEDPGGHPYCITASDPLRAVG